MDVISMSVGVGVIGIENVVVYLLVFLSIVDNYNCVVKDICKCVLGVFLGFIFCGCVDIINSYVGELEWIIVFLDM